MTNTGFYVLSPEFLDEIEDNKFAHITDIVERCSKEKHRIGIYSIDDECFIDVGQLEDLTIAHLVLREILQSADVHHANGVRCIPQPPWPAPA